MKICLILFLETERSWCYQYRPLRTYQTERWILIPPYTTDKPTCFKLLSWSWMTQQSFMSHDCRMIDSWSWSVLFLQGSFNLLHQDPCGTLKVLRSNTANCTTVLEPTDEDIYSLMFWLTYDNGQRTPYCGNYVWISGFSATLRQLNRLNNIK